MKSLRKSLNGSKDSVRHHISAPTPLPAVSKPPSSILPPQKVIRALSPYRPNAPQELPFKKGDFFYVLREVQDGGAWYEAHNPVSGARGLVPKSKFEEFNKNSSTLSRNSSSPNTFTQSSFNIPPPILNKAPKTFYAIVLHDFEAERADELDAKRGDAITVVAQSNREWFVAKPIGRLGRPGLIPVSFVEIHDPATGQPVPDVEVLMDGGDLPKVEDWKRAMFNYKQNSISLGVIDSPNNRDSVQNSPYNQPPPTKVVPPSPIDKQDVSDCLPDGILLSADVVSFHFEMEEYWFRIDAIFQPYPPPGQNRLPPAKHLVLFRVYNDFYDFQVSLLNSFPREAGREEPHPRMLPYMPGPAQSVDDALTATRRAELDEYLHSLCELSKVGVKYILESQVVREFLSLKPGDVESPTEPRVQEIEELISLESQTNGDLDEYGSEIRDTLGKMRVDDYGDRSDGSEYDDEGYAPSPQRQLQEQQKGSYDRHPYSIAPPPMNGRRPSEDNNLRLHAHSQNHNKTLSQTSINHRTPSPYSTNSRSGSPVHDRSSSPGNTHSRHHASASTSSLRSAAAAGRSRSHSTATSSTAPAISSANPQTAFVKIKIFDRVQDDLIAIRVHPKVTHAELVEKVQTRLGGELAALRYRDSAGDWIGLDTDHHLRAWIEGTDKHVLYAD
uniref:Polarity protein Bem1 n=1 Tax=Flammulina velutipes TaxID=38945 RepID=A0A6C0N1Q1_FLAVE|nr:polarity protein Bem1 [Flammulina velutipes]